MRQDLAPTDCHFIPTLPWFPIKCPSEFSFVFFGGIFVVRLMDVYMSQNIGLLRGRGGL